MSAMPSRLDEFSETVDLRPHRTRLHPEIGAITHAGKVRANNEDNYLVAKLAKSMRICHSSLKDDWTTRFSDEEGYLLVVADGMGGAAAGEMASRIAVETIEGFVLNVVKWFLHLGGEEAALLAELRRAFDRADASVIERARVEPGTHGMGTTLTMAFSIEHDLFLVHAGDSRAYLFRNGELHQMTNDHTLVNMLVQGGQITAEAAKHHARRNVVTNVIGGPSQGVHSEVHKVPLEDGDILLLCSDGLTEPVSDASIAEILGQQSKPHDACQHLIDKALASGAPDNVTVVIAAFRAR